MAGVVGSVGVGGANSRHDVIEVQRAINRHLASHDRLQVDGVCGPLTTAALIAYQQRELRMVRPDGLVEPNRRTANLLLGRGDDRTRPEPKPTSVRAAAAASRATTVADPTDPRLSGARWWHRNQAKYPNSSSLNDLAVGFKDKATNFIAALRDAGAHVSISATLRSRTRAKLMHYSWKVAHHQLAPADVPAIQGCDIIWDHGDLDVSRKAAREMVRLFHMAHQASLTSNHIKGLAVDMTVHWSGTLSIVGGDNKTVEVKTKSQLYPVGASYGVHKLVSDAPHWSSNGH